MDQIFNELSASGCYKDQYAAKDGLERFIILSKKLKEYGFNPTIRTTQDFCQRSLSNNFTIHDWASNRSLGINREYQRYILTYATKSPFIENFISDREEGILYECKFGAQPALGLGLAYLWEAPVLSLDAQEDYRTNYLSIEFTEIYGIDKLDVKNGQVISLWEKNQISELKDEIFESLRFSIKNGKEFLEQSRQILSNLSFCSIAIDQINKLTGSEQFFPEIVRHLFLLNDAMREWADGPYNPSLDWSTESESTLAAYSQFRQFMCPDGVNRLFKYKTKIKSANKRIYFFPMPEKKIVYIGYTGDHLPTHKYIK